MANSNQNIHLRFNSMTFTGQGQVSPIPNIAIIRLGVQTTNDNLSIAQSENAQISQNIIQSLKQFNISDIKTYQYLIEKNYDYENGTRIEKGYSVRNVLEIKLNNTDQAGIVIDTAVNNGANIVEYISFGVSNSEFYYQKALNLALMNAIQKSKSVAMQLGLPVEPIPIRIVENVSSLIPYQQNFIREGNFITPIEPGHYQIDASVTVEFYY